MEIIVSAGAVLISALLVYAQIQRQQKANLELQAEAKRQEIKAEVYREIADRLDHAGSALSKTLVDSLTTVIALPRPDAPIRIPPSRTAGDLIDANLEAAGALSAVLMMLERYEIVLPTFRTIRQQIAARQRTMGERFSSLHTRLSPYLLIRTDATPDGVLGPLLQPDQEALDELTQLQHEYGDVCSELSAYLMDIGIEAQNELLGALFSRALPPRNPEDPTALVLARDQEEAVQRPPGRVV